MAERTLSRTTSGVVSAQPGYYTGYVITTVTSSVVTIYDNATTNSGTILDVVPAAAAGTKASFNRPIRAANGLYAQFGGTGTVTFLFD